MWASSVAADATAARRRSGLRLSCRAECALGIGRRVDTDDDPSRPALAVDRAAGDQNGAGCFVQGVRRHRSERDSRSAGVTMAADDDESRVTPFDLGEQADAGVALDELRLEGVDKGAASVRA